MGSRNNIISLRVAKELGFETYHNQKTTLQFINGSLLKVLGTSLGKVSFQQNEYMLSFNLNNEDIDYVIVGRRIVGVITRME